MPRISAAPAYSGMSFLQCPLKQKVKLSICVSDDENISRSLDKYLPPWGVEFNKEVLVLLEFLIEVVVGKNEDTLIGLNC